MAWKILETVDDKLLDLCTKSSHKLQRATGITNYFVAKVGVGISSYALVIDLVNYVYQFFPEKGSIFSAGIEVICFADMIVRSIHCAKADKNLDNIKPAFLFTYTRSNFCRLLWAGWFLFDVGTLFLEKLPVHYQTLYISRRVLFSLGLAIFYYFIAVNPLPPGKSKVREWIDSFGKVLRPITQEN